MSTTNRTNTTTWILALAWSLAFLTTLAAAAQTRPAQKTSSSPPAMAVQQVTQSLYLVKGGSGANTAFFVTPKEVLVIDAKMSPEAAAAMLAEIAKVTSAPVTTIVITHSDGDHINGLPGLPKGLTIVAHEKCKSDIVAAAGTLPALKDYIPNKTYEKPRLTLSVGGRAVELVYFGPAHTSGDTVVWFPADAAAFVGDLIFVGRDPLIHRNKGGDSFGYVRTLQGLLDLSPPVRTFLSGHADPLGRADVEALKASMSETQARVRAMVAEGKSIEDVRKAFGIEEGPADSGARRWLSLAETVYLELTEKK